MLALNHFASSLCKDKSRVEFKDYMDGWYEVRLNQHCFQVEAEVVDCVHLKVRVTLGYWKYSTYTFWQHEEPPDSLQNAWA